MSALSRTDIYEKLRTRVLEIRGLVSSASLTYDGTLRLNGAAIGTTGPQGVAGVPGPQGPAGESVGSDPRLDPSGNQIALLPENTTNPTAIVSVLNSLLQLFSDRGVFFEAVPPS